LGNFQKHLPSSVQPLAYSTFGLDIKEPDVEIAKIIFEFQSDVKKKKQVI
jgi:hypothetical protein